MIPSMIELNCGSHLCERVVMIDQSPKIQGNSRALCLICIQEITKKQKTLTPNNHESHLEWIRIEEFRVKVAQYQSEKNTQIKEKFESEKKKLQDIKKSLITLRDETITDLNKIIKIIQDSLDYLNTKVAEELQNLKELGNIMSYQKLITVAEAIAEQTNQDSTINLMQQKLEDLLLQITNSQQTLYDNFTKKLNLIFKPSISNPNSQNESLHSTSLYKALPNNYDMTIIKNPQQMLNFQQKQQVTSQFPQISQIELLPKPKIEMTDSIIVNTIKKPQVQQFSVVLSQQQLAVQKSFFKIINPVVQPNQPAVSQINQPQTQLQTNSVQQKLNQTIKVEFQTYCQMECQILVSNALYSLIIGGVGCVIMIWEQKEYKLMNNQICSAHEDLVTGVAIYNTREMIVSGGQDKLLIVWRKDWQQKWTQIAKQEQNDEITNLILTLEDEQLIVSFKDFSVKCYLLDSQNKLNQIQQLNYQSQIESISVNRREEFMAIACREKQFSIYDIKKKYWSLSFKVITEGVVQQLHFNEDIELICQFSMPPLLIVYYISDEKYQIFQKIKLNVLIIVFQVIDGDIFESFPIFSIDQILCCQFGKMIYLLKKNSKGEYEAQKEIFGIYEAACSDISGKCIILKDRFKKQLQICSFN